MYSAVRVWMFIFYMCGERGKEAERGGKRKKVGHKQPEGKDSNLSFISASPSAFSLHFLTQL